MLNFMVSLPYNKAPKYTPAAKSAASARHATRCFACPLALRYVFALAAIVGLFVGAY